MNRVPRSSRQRSMGKGQGLGTEGLGTRTRCAAMCLPLAVDANRRRSNIQAAEAAVAGRVGLDRPVQIAFFEFGPAAVGHPNLGIADLPEQKIADPHFAGRADQQIGVGHAGRVQAVLQSSLR